MIVRIVNAFISNNDGVVECEVTRMIGGKAHIQSLPPIHVAKNIIADDEEFKFTLLTAIERIMTKENDISRFVGMEIKL